MSTRDRRLLRFLRSEVTSTDQTGSPPPLPVGIGIHVVQEAIEVLEYHLVCMEHPTARNLARDPVMRERNRCVQQRLREALAGET